MGTTGLCWPLCCFIILILFSTSHAEAAAFTEAPHDVSVGEGGDVEMPCAFRAGNSGPMSLEIQWWYLRADLSGGFRQELQPGAQASGAQVTLTEAMKISSVRVQGNAISHRLRLSKVTKEDEGVYECRVSDLRADQTLELAAQAALRVTTSDTMVAEEAVSHIQNRWPPGNTAPGGKGARQATSEPGPVLTGGQRSQDAQPDLLPSILSTATTSVAGAKSSVLLGGAASRQQPGADRGLLSTMEPLLFLALLHKLLLFLVVQ